eukprot:GHVU01019307.1.p1 GENE.GHVU01019307.1~~GHVU01019307.1.p1  ORF type:complete len:130 (-),score=0.19 GHVU01019307.1:506-895(-)
MKTKRKPQPATVVALCSEKTYVTHACIAYFLQGAKLIFNGSHREHRVFHRRGTIAPLCPTAAPIPSWQDAQKASNMKRQITYTLHTWHLLYVQKPNSKTDRNGRTTNPLNAATARLFDRSYNQEGVLVS